MKNYSVARCDVNQPEIVAALRAIGAYVKPVHTTKEFADLIVVLRGVVFIIEIKYPDGKHRFPKAFYGWEEEEKQTWLEGILKPGEKKAMEEVRAAGGKYDIVYDVESAIKVITRI